MNASNPKRFYIFISLLIFTAQLSIAQPGDKAFSVVTFDNHGYAACSYNYYKMYSCTVKYPNSRLRSGAFNVIWKPDLTTIKLLDTLTCTQNKANFTSLPYESYYTRNSCLSTDLLMVIRNNKDTMLISAGGSDYCSWLLDPNGYDLSLPFIFAFQKGLFYLDSLRADKSRIVLHNATYRHYLLSYYKETTPFYNPHNNRITALKTNQQIYRDNDTISITISGRVLNNGSCGGGDILWTMQKFENNEWVIQKDFCCLQMDCGTGPTVADHKTFPIFIQKDNLNLGVVTYPIQLSIPKGKMRLVVYDDNRQPYWTNEFTIE